jgi:hypothetical protein
MALRMEIKPRMFSEIVSFFDTIMVDENMNPYINRNTILFWWEVTNFRV